MAGLLDASSGPRRLKSTLYNKKSALTGQAESVVIAHANEKEAVGRNCRSGGPSVPFYKDLVNPFRRQPASADLDQRADEDTDHVV